MALSNTVAFELLEVLDAGVGVDLIRESVRLVLQELIEVEAAKKPRAWSARGAPTP